MDASGLTLLVEIALGVSLAASAGLRAFLPLFVVGVAQRFGIPNIVLGEAFHTGAAFERLSSDGALVVLGVAVLVEVLADKIPVLDNLLDVVAVVLKPVAGALVAAAVLSGVLPTGAALLAGAALGGVPAALVQMAKAKVRLLSSTTTGGLGNPVLSFLEDVLALAGTVTAILFSFLAVTLIAIGALLTARAFRSFRLRRDRIAGHLGGSAGASSGH